MQFDCSYSFNEDGQITFEIEIETDCKEWKVEKSLTDLRQLLINL